MRHRWIALKHQRFLASEKTYLMPLAHITAAARFYKVTVPELLHNVAQNDYRGYHGQVRYFTQWITYESNLFHDLYEHSRNPLQASTYEDEIAALGAAGYLRFSQFEAERVYEESLDILRDMLRKRMPSSNFSPERGLQIIKKAEKIFRSIPKLSSKLEMWLEPITNAKLEDLLGRGNAVTYTPEELKTISLFFQSCWATGIVRAHQRFPDFEQAQMFSYYWSEKIKSYVRAHNFTHVLRVSDTTDITAVNFEQVTAPKKWDRLLATI